VPASDKQHQAEPAIALAELLAISPEEGELHKPGEAHLRGGIMSR